MAKPKLKSLTVYPGEKGHRVVQEFHGKPTLRRGGLSGGLAMETAPTQEHNFGPGDAKGLLNHITSALALQSLAKQGGGGGAGGGGGGMPPAEEED